MKTIYSRNGKNSMLLRLTAFTLAFLFAITPFAPVSAADTESPVLTEPVIESPQKESVEPATVEPEPEVVTEPSKDKASKEDAITDEEDPKDPKKDNKKEELPTEPAPEALMAQPGPELNLASSSIKSGLPEVDKASGALVFNYPLNIPPGRSGMQPDLALVYNSQGGEEGKIFGDRWSLNLPSIERINRKGTDKLYTEDLFTSSIDGELVDLGSGVFRPKVQNSEFIKYEYASSAWIATDKKGTKYKFGTSASSRLDKPSDSTKIFRWMVDDVRDLNGNYVKYEYYKDQGEIYPSRIVYTGNGSTDGVFEVEFTRTAQSEPVVTAKPGFTITATYHLTEILISINDSWVRKYTLAYTSADNGQDALLNTITETGRDESLNTIALPAEDFDYQLPTGSGSAWALDSISDGNWNAPVDTKDGIIIADANGDGLDDFIQGLATTQEYKRTWLNTGSGWSLSNDFVPPIIFKNDNVDEGVRGIDVNGDGLVDLVRRKSGVTTATYLNNGTGWTQTSNWLAPEDLGGSVDPGTRFGDFNGDGLPDIIKNNETLYLNNGTTGWTSIAWTIPVDVEEGVLIADVNGDGLDDLAQSWTPNGTTFYQKTWLNNGAGWTLSSDYVPPVLFADQSLIDGGVRAVDANGDGLVDLLKKIDGSSAVTYLNDGDGWTSTSYWNAPLPFILSDSGATDTGTRFGDFDGDGKIDFLDADTGGSVSTNLYLHSKTKANLLSKITYPRAGFTDVVYQGSGKYMSGSTILNPNLPTILVTVKSITHDDGFNTDSSATYTYEGGKNYYNGAYDRRLAGFSKITKVDAAGNKVKTFYHQGDISNSSQGEYSDHVSKIGKIYRVEITDSSDNIYVKKVSKWENYDLGSGRNFVKLTRTTELTYDADTDHKDRASTYIYNDANGNLTQQVDWGEVTGSDDGSFTDTGSDKFTTDVTYASNTTLNILGLPKQETVTDQNSNKVRESKYYYDVQAHGSVNVGNLTKEEKWKTGSTYIDVEKTYNTTYGIVTSEKDPRDKTTSYTYDSYNLYPTTVTNALNQVTSYTYDYSLGKPKQVTDPNSRVFQTVFDALDRIVEEKQPDLTTPTTLVTKTAYTYTSQSVGNKVQKTDYFDSTTTVDTITYTDGFDRPVQTRTEMEDSNTYAVTDVIYNNIEQVYKESLPYSSSGTSKTTATTTTALLITYSYDPMYRVTTTVNAVGTVTNAYDDWKQTITDARSKVKYLYKDAYGNLIKVEETNSGSTYTTLYEYNGNGNLTKITDALSNIRNFTYDGLGRRLTAQDLHASADTSFGSWTYTYDDSGNLTSLTDSKSQQIDYTYDDINRRLTENYTGQAGTEVTYTYDSGTDGTGRLASVTATGANTSYLYNPHGKVKRETKTINSTNYQTDYTFDRQGNELEVTNPDSSKVKYAYNTAGQLETIQRKESTDGSYANVVTDFDYGPHGKVTYQANQNGTATTNTYDATKLYRLSAKSTTMSGSSSSITFDATSVTSEQNNTSSVTLSHTTGSLTNGLIVVGLQFRNGSNSIFPSTTSCTYNGSSLTLAKAQNGDSGTGRYMRSELWYGVNPTSGAHNVVCNFSSSVQMVIMGASTYSGVAQSSSLDVTAGNNNTSTNTPTVSLTTSVANALVVDSMESAFNTSVTVGSGQTQLWQGTPNSGTDRSGSSDKIPTSAGSATMSWYNPDGADEWVSAAAAFKPATGSSGYSQQLAYTYDANGNITKIIDSSNTNSAKTVDYTYDDLNRLLTATTSNPASGQSNYTHTFTYDAIGNILTGPAGTYTYAGNTGTSYANPHAVTSIASSGGTASITHDATSVSSEANNVTSITLSHTTGTLTNGLIVVGLQIRNGANGVFTGASSCTYNGTALTLAKVQNGDSGSGRYLRSEEWYGVNPASGAHNVVCNFSSSVQMVIMGASTYSGVDQTTPLDATASNSNTSSDTPSVSITTTVANALVVDSMEGAFNTSVTPGSGQTQLWQGTPNGGTDHTGSSRKIPTSSGATTMSWFCSGGADEWVSVAASFKPATTSTTTNYTYDNNGNLTGDGTWTNIWNYQNRLTQSAKTGTTVTYAYDHTGQRVKLANGTTTTVYPTQEYSLEGSTPVKHINGSGGLVATVKGTGGSASIYYAHTDHLTGSSVISNTSGTQEELLDYFPYGTVRLDQKSGSFGEVRQFTGYELDADTGLNYAGQRYYNSAIGRFISEDPSFLEVSYDLTDPQTGNSYSYANNNPLRFTDPDGRFGRDTIANFMGGFNNAYYTNYVFGYGRNNDTSGAYRIGQSFGDGVSFAQGLLEVAVGAIIGTGGVVVSGTGVGVAVGVPAAVGGAALAGHGSTLVGSSAYQFSKSLSQGEKNTDVYIGSKNGKDSYVGISKDVDRRAAQHGDRFDSVKKINESPLTRNQARGVEQVIKENNPQFENKINSISPKNPIYQGAKDFGNAFLKAIGIKK